MRRVIILITFLFFLSGCTTLYNPATGRNEFILIDTKTEVAIGRNVIDDFIRRHPLSDDENLQRRIQRIGRQIASVSDRQDIEYEFKVLRDKELNALTLPGGFIYINKGLADKLTDDEIAYVLAHEVGHTAAKHIAKKLQANMAYQLLLSVAFASIGSRAQESAANVARGIDAVYNLIGLSYSRKDEFEADRLAAKYVFKAGFNPYACLSALEKIKKSEGPNWKVLKYFRTHPYVDERIEALKANISQLKNSP
jgi:predicted Zn-dependent protease